MKTRYLLSAFAVLPSMAFAAPAKAACSAEGARPLAVGKLEQVPAGTAPRYTVDLAAGEGLQIELAPLDRSGGSEDDESDSKTAPSGLAVCDASGKVIAPLPSEVFASGGSLSRADDGTLTLRVSAARAGRYLIAGEVADGARELLLRPRAVTSQPRPAAAIEIGGSDFVKISSKAPRVWSFAGRAGQWVKITVNSENDTVLHLAAPMGNGYEVIADNDDTDGLNPRIVRKLPVTGTYYVQLESLGDDAADATLLIQPTQAPPPPPPPTPLRAGAPVRGKLADDKDTRLYVLPVTAGHAYRLELNAPYDAVLEVGQADPLEPDDGAESAGFASSRSADDNTSGTEKLRFTARSTGQVMVRVRSFGTGDSDGSYTLVATDTGG